jgi:hypothetical protein
MASLSAGHGAPSPAQEASSDGGGFKTRRKKGEGSPAPNDSQAWTLWVP